MVGLDWVFKILDWIWIAKYDSPLFSGQHQDKAQPIACDYLESLLWSNEAA